MADPLCNSKENIDRACKAATDIIEKLPQELQLDLKDVRTCLDNIAMDDHEGGDFHHTGK